MVLDDLHVLVLGYGAGDEHVELVRSLIDEGVRSERIALVHNPSVGGQEPVTPPAGRVLRLPRNVGYGAAMNVGIRDALREGAALVLLLTHDCRLRRGTLHTLVDAATGAPGLGILGPALRTRGQDAPFSYGGIREPYGWVGHRRQRPPVDENGAADCDWIDGAAMLVRRAVFEEVGLLEERYFMYFEETDLCLRARGAGWRVGVVVDAVAEQSLGASRRPGGHAYLSTRNGLEHARRAWGGRGAMRAAYVRFRRLARLVLAYPQASADRATRTQMRAEMGGTCVGLVHFVTRRWGPPPRWVPGLGDIEGEGTATPRGWGHRRGDQRL